MAKPFSLSAAALPTAAETVGDVSLGAPAPYHAPDPWEGGALDRVIRPETNPSLYDVLKPHQLYLINTVAGLGTKQSSLDNAFNLAKTGQSVDDQVQAKKSADALQNAGMIAQATAHLSDDQFNKVLAHIQDRIASSPPLPTRPELQDPNWQQSALAIIGAALDPKHAAELTALPLQSRLGDQQTGYQQNVQNYQLSEQQRQNDIHDLESLGGQITQRDSLRANLENDQLNRDVQMRGQDQTTTRSLLDNLESAPTSARLRGAIAALNAAGIHLPQEVLDNLVSEAQKVESEKEDDKKTKLREDNIAKYYRLATTAPSAASRRLNALTAMHMMSPDDPRRADIEAALPDMEKATAAEIYKMSAAGFNSAKTEDLQLTRPARIFGMLQNGLLKQAAAEYERANTDLVNARTKLVDLQVEWYPKEAKAKLDKMDAETTRALKQANKLANDALYSAKGGRPITQTAYTQLHDRIIDSLGKYKGNIALLDVEKQRLETRLKDLDPKGSIKDREEAKTIQQALDANASRRAFLDGYVPTLEQRKADIEKLNPSAMPEAPFDPTTGSGFWSIQPDRGANMPPAKGSPLQGPIQGKTPAGRTFKVVG